MTTPMEEVHNYTREEVEVYLAHLQHDSTMAYIPTFVYMFLIILVGLLGNSLVIVVYTFKMTTTPLRIFIVALAVFDLLTNAIIMPGKTYDLLHVWNFEMPSFCKVRMYLNASLVISSGLILAAVATIRYMIVCHPFKKRVTLTQAKRACVIIAIISFFISIPYGLIHGTQTRKTPNPRITARYCQVDDSYVSTIWPRLNSGFFIFVFTVCSSTVIYFYICIARVTWTRRNSLVVSERSSSEGRGSNSKDTEGCDPPEKLEEEHYSKEDELSEVGDSEHSSKHGSQRTSGNNSAKIPMQGVIVSRNKAQGDECDKDDEDGFLEGSQIQKTFGKNSMATISNEPPNCTELLQSNTYFHNNWDNQGDNNWDNQGRKMAASDLSITNSPENKNTIAKDVKKQTSLDSNKRSANIQTTLRRRQSSDKRRRLFERTSLMMFVITLVFFLSFLPFLGLNVFLALAPEKVAALEGASLAMYQLFLCSYLLNSAANSIVYSFFDRRFRKECLIFLKCYKKTSP